MTLNPAVARHPMYRRWHERISRITDSIYVGEIMNRAFPEFLDDLGIDTVISILSDAHEDRYGKRMPVSDRFTHHWYHYDDNDAIEPARMLEIVESFGDRTLVHCISGSNRSTCVTIARLIYEGMPPITACHTYWTGRGAQLAKVYQTIPTMYPPMLANLEAFAAWLEAR